MDDKTKAGLLGDIEYFSAKLEADGASMLFLPLAKAYVELTRFDDAAQVLIRGLDANPEVSTAKTLLAQCYVGMGRVDEAKALLTEIRVLDPNNYAAEKLLGKIYQSENEYKKAIISYKNAFFSAPEDPELRELIEELLAETGMELSDLRDERKLMEDDELLETIGQELADEVKHEIGDAAEKPNLTDAEVKSAVDDIVGLSPDFDENSLDQFAEDDSPADTSGEIESEMLSEVSDRVEHIESLDAVKEAVREQEQSYFADAGEHEENVPVDGGIDNLAAELSADFGLDSIKSEEEVFADEEPVLAAEEEKHAEETVGATAEETAGSGQSVFDDFDDFEEVADEHLASIDDLFNFVPVSEDGEEMEAPSPAAQEEQAVQAESAETVEEMEDVPAEEPEEIDADEQLADITSEVVIPEEKQPAVADTAETEEPVETEQAETVAEEEQYVDTVAEEPAVADSDEAVEELPETEQPEIAQEEENEPAAEPAVIDEPVAEDILTETAEEPAEIPEESVIEADVSEEILDEVITDEKIDDALKEVLEQETIQEDEPAAEDGEPAEAADEIILHGGDHRSVIDVQEVELLPSDELPDFEEDSELPEDVLAQEPALVSEIQQEINRDTELNDELATLFALNEIEERDKKTDSDEYVNTNSDDMDTEDFTYDPEQLDDETYEQVNKLENLLELIKNNSK
ncbi:MAG: tetratricopeptide repeat protein [Deferribacterales bacterium]